MFPDYIVENKDFLQNLSKTKSPKKIIKLIRNASDEQLLAIVEICYNILRGELQLKNHKRKSLSVYGDYFRTISRARTPKAAANRIQTGGNPAVIGAIIAPVLGALAQNLLDRALSKDDEAR